MPFWCPDCGFEFEGDSLTEVEKRYKTTFIGSDGKPKKGVKCPRCGWYGYVTLLYHG